MLIVFLAFAGGVLTILSPCILPILPFVFAPTGRPFRSHTLPMLISMALAFAVVAALTAVGATWAVTLHVAVRYAAIALLALFGGALLLPQLAERLTRPLVRLGERLASGGHSSRFAPWALGLGTGLLWTPCAGPILGVLLASAALHGPGVGTTFLLLAYAAGASTALACAWFLGQEASSLLRNVWPAAESLRRLAGAAILAAIAFPALGLDSGLLTRIPAPGTTALEQALVDRIQTAATGSRPRAVGPLDALAGATGWINTPALDAETLRGKVVLVNFWTYSCINCLRTLPYVKAWAEKYRGDGLVVVGVHTPEFAFEKSVSNVKRAVADLGITYPIAMDNDYRVWRGLQNSSWPAFYLIDAQGRVREEIPGEHSYEQSERLLRKLLAERGTPPAGTDPVHPLGEGTQAAPDLASLRSGEIYVGYMRAAGFDANTRLQRDRDAAYTPAEPRRIGSWTIGGQWRVEAERAVVVGGHARILHRFHARDLHMVLGSGTGGHPVRFRVLVDGKAPGDDHGTDTNAQGEGVIDGQKLYQLVRQRGAVRERLFEIEFLDEGAEAYAFTFG